jgi:ATP-binding cassette subfamily C protein
MNLKTIFKLKPLVTDFWQFAPKRILVVIGFMLLSSVTSSIGILFIVPLLEAINIDLGSGVSDSLSGNFSSDIGNRINAFFDQFGINLDLFTVLAVYLFVVILKALITLIHSIIAVKLQSGFVISLRKKVYTKLFYSEWQYLNQEHIPDFIRLVTGQVEMAGYSLQQLLNLCSNIILVSVYIALAILVSPALTLLALGLAITLVVIMLPLNALIHRSGKIELLANTNIFRDVFEQISSLKIIKSFSAEDKCIAKIQKTNVLMESQQIKMTFYNAITRFINLVGAALIFSILFYTAIDWLKLPIANLLLILFIFSRLMPQVSGLQNIIMQLIHQAPTYVDLLERTEELSKHAEPITPTNREKSSIKVPDFIYSIKIKNLEFTYPNTKKPAIEGICAEIGINQSIAITGPSGAGKSTLADIVAGLIKPDQGELLVDDCVISDNNRQHWRKQVAYVTQDIYLFHDSVRNNLSWLFNDDISEKELWIALELAAADSFVRKLPQGIDTLIGDNGVKLSGGERQRLALARALLSQPKVLILDEATSALDRENELKIRDALIKLDGKLTIIVIAHNDTTIDHINHRINLK